jgi:hypothetical protein
MITIKHKNATLTVLPENTEHVRELLAKIDKSKGRRGRVFKKPKAREIAVPPGRAYPVFNARVMLTSDYVMAYARMNAGRQLKHLPFEPEINRIPPRIDPWFPEVLEEIES